MTFRRRLSASRLALAGLTALAVDGGSSLVTAHTGAMADVVNGGTQFWRADDLSALADYLLTDYS